MARRNIYALQIQNIYSILDYNTHKIKVLLIGLKFW
jgi:hypothetical protein